MMNREFVITVAYAITWLRLHTYIHTQSNIEMRKNDFLNHMINDMALLSAYRVFVFVLILL